MIASLLVVFLAGPAPAAPSEPPPSANVTESAHLERGYLRVEGLEREPLVDALVLRVPHLRFEPFEAAVDTPPGTLAAFVDLRRGSANSDDPEATSYALTIVVSDGRAFDRTVQTSTDDDETSRLLASTVANLLLAIEAGTVPPDRADVPVPTPAPTTAPPCEPQCPPTACPTPSPLDPERAEPPPPRPQPRFELGPVVAVGTILGLGQPAQADRFAALGATVGAHARLRGGAFFGLEARTSGRSDVTRSTLFRQRFALGGGYRLRRASWSLGASLWATLEPWWVRGATPQPPPRPLWGMAARITPSLYRIGLANGRLDLAAGPVIEMGISASLDGGGPSIGLVTVEDQGVVLSRRRVGGLELSTGLAVTLWTRPRARR